MADLNPNYPMGTVEELQEIGRDPRNYASCARAVEGRIRGCQHYDKCRFRKTRDANEGRGAGPENFGFMKILHVGTPDEVSNGHVLPCYAIMETEHQHMRQADITNRAYSRFYEVGEFVPRRETRRKHVTRVADCPSCQSKEGCTLMIRDEIIQVEVKAHPRPKVTMGGSVFSKAIRDSIHDEIDFESRVGGIVQNPPNPRTAMDLPDAAGGTGRGQTLQEQVKKAK